jgi:hypothetical protein
MSRQTGQCLCGSILYEISADPVFSANCHCTHCQKATGSAFSSNIGIPLEAFKITGNSLGDYVDQGDSGQPLHRYFCNQCGSPIYTLADSIPGVAIVKVGTLNDTSGYQPEVNIWCASKMQWLKKNKAIVDFDQTPDR